MKVAIVGSREYRNHAAVFASVEGLAPGDVVISGGAKGPDTWAAESVRSINKALGGNHLGLIVLAPDWSLGKSAGLKRNSEIVTMCDRVIAHWDGRSRGTLDTITKAVRAGKPVAIVPDHPEAP